MLHILCLKTCRIVQIYTLFMIGGPNFIPRNTTQLNKIDNYRAPSGLKTRTGNCWYWHLREPQEWPWCFMEQAPEPSWASFPLLCLWHHYLSVGRFRILDSKNWVGQPLLVRTARTTRSVICWAIWAIQRRLTSSHPPSIPKAHREVFCSSDEVLDLKRCIWNIENILAIVLIYSTYV